MFELFDECYYEAKRTGNYANTFLVGNNLFSKYSDNEQLFGKYINFLFEYYSNVKKDDSLLELIGSVISRYSEKTELSMSKISLIRNYEAKLNAFIQESEIARENEKRDSLKKVIVKNDDNLNLIKTVVNKLSRVTSENEFNLLLEDIRKLDSSLDINNFVERQKNEYDELTKASTKIIDEKMRFFEYQKNVEYNKQALNSYERIFNIFKNGNSGGYGSGLIKELFEYDPSRLFNETIVYYNHVYNYILSKLGDEDKLAITKLAIMCEKKR